MTDYSEAAKRLDLGLWSQAAFGVGMIICAIAAVVFANQPAPELALLGRLFHLSSIAAACGLLVLAAGIGSLVYVSVCAALFAVGLTGFRLPYETALCVLFLGAGAIIGARCRDAAANAVVAITLASGVFMLLQVGGVGEWTQALTTHGINEGFSLSKEPFPTLFVEWADIQGNYLQGRPAGLLHSNQFASLVILFALALSMSRRGSERSLTLDAALCVTAVLALAKVVFLGLALLLAFQYVFGGREGRTVAVRFAALTAIALAVYAVLFPGLFQIYIFNFHNVWQSVAVRLADMLSETLGWSTQEVLAFLRYYDGGMRESGQLTASQLLEIASKGSRVSAVTALAKYDTIFFALSALAVLVLSSSRAARLSVRTFARDHITQEHISILIVLATFCLAANFLGAPIFWMMVGFAVPIRARSTGKEHP